MEQPNPHSFVPEIQSVHGQNPQSLIEKIIRDRIKESLYWKEECFGLNAATLVDKAVKLEYVGGVYGGTQKPTPFICLLFRMLQIQPDMSIVLEFINNSDFKYLRALGVVYLRFVAPVVTIYEILEPLFQDYRKLCERKLSGEFSLVHMDELIDKLLHEDKIFNLVMPRIPKRSTLEKTQQLAPYISPLEAELNESDEDIIDTETNHQVLSESEFERTGLKFKASQNQSDTIDTTTQSEIDASNALRKKLGLNPLK